MLRAYWYKRHDTTDTIGNVGDMLTPIILKHFTKKEIVWSDKPGKILACGSIIELMDHNDIVWGSGIIDDLSHEKKDNVRILAVRGKLTRDYLFKYGYNCPAVYGDPAQLMPLIYKPSVTQKHRYGFVSHYVEKKEFKEWFGGHQINIINNPYLFIEQLLECEHIVTSSLHAYILAKAYGVTAEYVQLTDRIIGGYFKYKDFESGQLEYDQNKLINALINGVSKVSTR